MNLKLTIGLLALSPMLGTFANPIDQRDPDFQMAMEHLSRARHALEVFENEMAYAQATYPLPGLDVVGLVGSVQESKETLNLLLTPEDARMRYQIIQPDGFYFKPIEPATTRKGVTTQTSEKSMESRHDPFQ
jgi:hypothetical protein